jgi:N-acetylmuramic acid 6-phosphate etherase
VSENPHPLADELDSLTTLDLLGVIHREDRNALDAVQGEIPEIAVAVNEILPRLRAGGRLHYFGVGNSGRMAAVDAAECPATFGVDRRRVQAHESGDGSSEDDQSAGRQAARRANLGPNDVAVGVSASGGTKYVAGALEEARAAGALIVVLVCAIGSPLVGDADIAIEIPTGPEVIAGSTRMKAGTAQKVVLNMISSAVFTRLGYTYRGRMVGVVADNDKLRRRAARIVSELTEASVHRVDRALADSDGDARLAVLMVSRGFDVEEARLALSLADGSLAVALDSAWSIRNASNSAGETTT